MKNGNANRKPLRLRAGDAVEVHSEEEILATLDDHGAVDGQLFMPEMLEYCGKRFRVYKRADKTCDTITLTGARRMYDTVHLEGLRCNGQAHGGCQALCFLFWKEAWLKRVDGIVEAPRAADSADRLSQCSPPAQCTRERLFQIAQCEGNSSGDEVRYRCQATDLLQASEPISPLDVRQYLRDIYSGNRGVLEVIKSLLFRLFYKTLHIRGYRAQLSAYNRFQKWRGGTPFPYLRGTLDETPRQTLDLKPGELVQVKSYGEILETLNTKNRNRGLYFDPEMVPYCETKVRVLARVERIVDERNGKMMHFSTDCIMLEGAVCRAKYSDRRLFCPRSIYPFWREIWLKRVEGRPIADAGSVPVASATVVCPGQNEPN